MTVQVNASSGGKSLSIDLVTGENASIEVSSNVHVLTFRVEAYGRGYLRAEAEGARYIVNASVDGSPYKTEGGVGILDVIYRFSVSLFFGGEVYD